MRVLTAATLAILLVAAPAAADEPGEGACAALSISGRPTEHAFDLPGGARAALRDPYGGLIFRNRLFVSFAVKAGTSAERRRLVDHVEWRLDGESAPLQRNRGGAYALQVLSTRFPPGVHKLTAHVVARDGATVDKTITISATDCQPVSFFADIHVNRGRRAAATLSVGSGGPDMRSVSFTALRGLRAAAPAATRGRAVGSLSFYDGTFPFRAQAQKPLRLRMPRAPGGTAVLLRRGALRVTLRPGRRRMLDVTGLPARTRGVRVRLASGIIAPLRGCPVRSDIAALVTAIKGGAAGVRNGIRC